MAGIYCDHDSVKRYVSTTLSDADIDLLCEDTDADIDAEIGPQNTGNKLIRKLASLKTAIAIKNRDPQMSVVGPFRAEQNPLAALEREIGRITEMFSTRVATV